LFSYHTEREEMTDFLLTYSKKYTKNYEGLPSAYWQGIILIGINAFTFGIYFFLSLYFVNAKQFTPSTSGLLLFGGTATSK